MEEKEFFMTEEGKRKLEEELNYLKVSGRSEVAEKIRVAREFGDLSENAEYDIAKDEQGKMEARIIEIEEMLRNAKIISKGKGDKVNVGSTVTIKHLVTGVEKTYVIVGALESNPLEGKISNESPIGKALIGARRNDVVTVHTPRGDVQYKITEMKFLDIK